MTTHNPINPKLSNHLNLTDDDQYFASVKKMILPFIMLNIAAVVVGAAVVNIIYILDRPVAAAEIAQLAEPIEPINAAPSTDETEPVQPIAIPQPIIDTQGAETGEPATENEMPILAVEPADEIIIDKATNGPITAQSGVVTQPIEKSVDNADVIAADFIRPPEEMSLLLPTLDVTSQITDIPIVDGNWDISELEQDVGILDGFPSHPDDPGALVVAGHATTIWPTAGPFIDLRLMSLGDPVIFQTETAEYVYEITRFLRVETSNVDVLRKGGEDGIVLVTCGSYNYLTGVYGKRFIAYGDLVEVRPLEAELDTTLPLTTSN